MFMTRGAFFGFNLVMLGTNFDKVLLSNTTYLSSSLTMCQLLSIVQIIYDSTFFIILEIFSEAVISLPNTI